MKNNIYTVCLKNKDGKFVKASVETISSSAKSYQASADDFTASLINKEGSDAYPISAFTYFLLPIKEKDSKLSEIHNFFNWSLSDGQKYAKDLYYAPLPKNVADKVLKKIKGL